MKIFLLILLLLPALTYALDSEDIKEWKLIESDESKIYLGLPYIKNGDKVILIEKFVLNESYSPGYSGWALREYGFYNTQVYDCKNHTIARKHVVSILWPHRDKKEPVADEDLKFQGVGNSGSDREIMNLVCK
ncbi:hypothetical protein RFH42_16470 [Acinetobacter rudis]|uniref:hypothetical protein n=1 Tax=Acinetobacter rudis TaxID=632955 RepID=UPI00280D5C3A|nr:hypothetical protein [Acinetobacter rudis]MDQ8954546.1 hypothetical protein [Acinetobacter rudis]